MLGFWAFCLGTWYLLNLSIFATGHVLPAVVLLGENHWFAPARQFSFPSLVCSVLPASHDHVHGKNELLRFGIHAWRALGVVFFWQENHVCKWQEARKESVLQLFGPKEYSVLLLLLSSMSTCLLVFYLERIMPLCASTFMKNWIDF